MTFQWYYGLLENLRGISQWIVVSAGGKFEDTSNLMLNYSEEHVYIHLPNQYRFSLSLYSQFFSGITSSSLSPLASPLISSCPPPFPYIWTSFFSFILSFVALVQIPLFFLSPFPSTLGVNWSEYLSPLDQFTWLGLPPCLVCISASGSTKVNCNKQSPCLVRFDYVDKQSR